MELVKEAERDGYISVYEYGLILPRFIIFLDTNAAVDLASVEINDIINDKSSREYPQDAIELSENISRNEKLGQAFFNFFNAKMNKLKAQPSPSFSIFNERWFSDDLFCALLKHNPKGLKDSLINDIEYLQTEASKIHPNTYSFIGDIWQFVQTASIHIGITGIV